MGYSPERRSAVLKRMLPPNNMAIRQLAQEEGMRHCTSGVRRRAARVSFCPTDAGPEGWSSRDMETAALNEADMAEAGCFRRRSRPGVWPASRRMTGTASTARLGKATKEERRRVKDPRKDDIGVQRCLFCEKRHQRSGGTERTHDQHPRSPNRHCPDQ